MKKYSIETAVGVFMVLGLICVGYMTVKLGKVEIPQAGKFTLVVRPHDAKHWKAINLASVKLAKAK